MIERHGTDFHRRRVSERTDVPASNYCAGGLSVNTGKLPASQIAEQIKVLNSAFTGTGFSYTLAATDYTDNSRWYNLRRVASRSAT